jgi:uncharacterized protein
MTATEFTTLASTIGGALLGGAAVGSFDPSLLFVMAAAVAVTFVGYRLVLRRRAPAQADRFGLPAATDSDTRLVAGAALFGIGWGLSGFCPGPALVSLALLAKGTLTFVPAILAGIALARLLRIVGHRGRPAPAQSE